MKKLVVEFIGTFFLILAVVTAVSLAPAGFAPIAIGGMLMVMIFAGGHISGAHYNPAVTLAVLLRGKIEIGEAVGYWAVQLAAGAAAALVGTYLVGGVADAAVPQGAALNAVPSLLGEFLGTFALAYVVLHTATAKGTAGNSFYGLAIGFTVTACAYALGGISGGAFNPAVAVGVSTAGMAIWSDIWIFLVGNLAGGALAAIVFLFVNGDD